MLKNKTKPERVWSNIFVLLFGGKVSDTVFHFFFWDNFRTGVYLFMHAVSSRTLL